jgi:hypothetical protein
LKAKLAIMALALVVSAALLPRTAAAASPAVEWKLALIRAQEQSDRQNYDEAVKSALDALRIADAKFGPKHLFALKTLNLLAEIYRHQGNEKLASSVEDRVLEIRAANALEDLFKTERRFGAQHVVTAGALSALAQLKADMNRNEEALALLQRALAIREKSQGKDHPDVAGVLDQIADAHQELGDEEQARDAILRALHIRQAKLGPYKPETLDTVIRLGEYYVGAGDSVTAEFYYTQALNAMRNTPRIRTLAAVPLLMALAQLYAGRDDNRQAAPLLAEAAALQEKFLGAEHADLADTYDLQAAAAVKLEQYEAAEKFLVREFTVYVQNGQETTRDAAACLEMLSSVYADEKQNAKAEAILAQALQIREKILGRDNPELLGFIFNLAEFNMTIGDQERAEQLFLRVAASPLTATDPNVQLAADALSYLGGIAGARNDNDKAVDCYQAALRLNEKAFGPRHVRVAASLDALAAFLISLARLDEAKPLLQRALAIQEEALGKETLELALTLSYLGEVDHYNGDFQESAKHYLRALKIRETLLGPDHPEVAVTLNDLALMHHSAGNRAKAEKLYRRALTILKKVYGEDHPLTLVVLGNLEALRRNEEP